MNEVLLLIQALVCAAIVFLAWRLDRERLYGVITILLIAIAVTGGKVVDVFGHSTNTGNILYASVFLATYFLIERYGSREGMRSILIGFLGIVFFMSLARLAVGFSGNASTETFDTALGQLLAPSYRIAFASIIAFACSQFFNVWLYVYLKTHMQHIGVWLRANTANLFAQILDSAIFFIIAFWGVVSPEDVMDAFLTGLVVKIVFMAAFSPLLYLNGFEEENGKEYTSITWR